jgi:hypothetical protein
MTTEYMHYRSTLTSFSIGQSRGATLAITPKDAKTVLVSIALCGPNDIFSKKMGRTIAAGRLEAFKKGRDAVSKYIVEVEVDDMSEMKNRVAAALEQDMVQQGLV